ncbi:hypothetical protein U0070_013295, partial [Myodes glareolus]
GPTIRHTVGERRLRWLRPLSPGSAPFRHSSDPREGRSTCLIENTKVRLKPKAKLTPKIQKLLNREARNYALSFKEAKLLRKYKDSTSVLLVTCRTCNRTVKHYGKSRSFLSALKSNAATATNKVNLKTPKRNTPGSTHPSHKMSDSKGKSPSLTFRYLNSLICKNTRIWAVNTRLLLKEWEQKKETLLSTKSAA